MARERERLCVVVYAGDGSWSSGLVVSNLGSKVRWLHHFGSL